MNGLDEDEAGLPERERNALLGYRRRLDGTSKKRAIERITVLPNKAEILVAKLIQ